LTKYLQQWKNQRYIDTNKGASSIVEPAPDTIFSAVQTVWQQMQGLGEQQLVKREQEFQEEKDLWERTHEALKAQLAHKDSVIDRLSEDYASTKAQLESLLMEHHHLQADHRLQGVRLEEIVAAADARYRGYEQTISEFFLQITALSDANARLQSEHNTTLLQQRSSFEDTLSQAQVHHQQQYQELLMLSHKDQLELASLRAQLHQAADLKEISVQVMNQNMHLENQMTKLSQQCTEGFEAICDKIPSRHHPYSSAHALISNLYPVTTKKS
jgi:hypothetical protein